MNQIEFIKCGEGKHTPYMCSGCGKTVPSGLIDCIEPAKYCPYCGKSTLENGNKIIYAITSGSYSDYHVCAITTDKERAEQLKLFYTDSYDDAEIEEYADGDPDRGNLQNLRPVFGVWKLADGTWDGCLKTASISTSLIVSWG